MGAAYLKAPVAELTHLIAPASCSGKQQFTTPAKAREVASRSRHASRTHYQCQFCGFWHVGKGALERQKSVALQRLVRGET
jgi:hypothetical protein